jgi:hypothetical protein
VIELNVIVPANRSKEIQSLESEKFRIVHTSRELGGVSQYFNIQTTEEEATLLTLKFGKENVWKR